MLINMKPKSKEIFEVIWKLLVALLGCALIFYAVRENNAIWTAIFAMIFGLLIGVELANK